MLIDRSTSNGGMQEADPSMYRFDGNNNVVQVMEDELMEDASNGAAGAESQPQQIADPGDGDE